MFLIASLHLFSWIGMLFRNMFTIKVSVDNPFRGEGDGSFSLALHSRHTVTGDDGSFVQDEIKCLHELLPQRTSHEACVVYLMSDRPTTVRLLTEWLHEQNCTGISTIPSSSQEDVLSSSHSMIAYKDEHGPNSGVGFIRDLALSSHARSGIIGDRSRSSSRLLAELIAYDRRIDDWKRRKSTNDDHLSHCQIPKRTGHGYNYGPGTPTFRASHRLTPLEPINVLNQYKSWHSVDALASDHDFTNRRFAIGVMPCEGTTDGLYQFLNGT